LLSKKNEMSSDRTLVAMLSHGQKISIQIEFGWGMRMDGDGWASLGAVTMGDSAEGDDSTRSCHHMACGKAAMLAQSDGVSSPQSRAIRNRNGAAPRSSCGAQPRVRPNSPSKADLDRKSKGIVLLIKTGPRCISFRCKITVSLAQGAVHDAEADVADPVFVRSTISAAPKNARPSRTRLDGGGCALVGMDGLCGELSRRQHRWPVAPHGADRRQVASVLLSFEGAVALAILARRGRAGSIRLCPRLGADVHATRPLRNQ